MTPEQIIQSCDLDHIVIATPDLQATRDEFEAIGFTVSPRQEHEIFGTANHLIVLSNCYIELLGIKNNSPSDMSSQKIISPVIDQGGGLPLLALTHAEPELVAKALSSLRYDVNTPKSWSRKALTPDGEKTASFTTFFFSPSLLPETQTFFCRHRTPQYIYHAAWQRHSNGAEKLFSIARHTITPTQPLVNFLNWAELDVERLSEFIGVSIAGWPFKYRIGDRNMWEIDLSGAHPAHRYQIASVAGIELVLPTEKGR